jgi:hypothetical protein
VGLGDPCLPDQPQGLFPSTHQLLSGASQHRARLHPDGSGRKTTVRTVHPLNPDERTSSCQPGTTERGTCGRSGHGSADCNDRMLPMSAKDWLEVDGYTLLPPSTPVMVSGAEERLGIILPTELRDLLLTADGVLDCTRQWDVIWPLERIVKENLTAWELEGPPRTQWLGFGDDGTRSPFCVATLGDRKWLGGHRSTGRSRYWLTRRGCSGLAGSIGPFTPDPTD